MALSFAKKLVFAGVATVLGLGVLELVARPVAPAQPLSDGGAHDAESAMRASDLLGWEAVPGPSRAFGIRGQTTVGPEGTRRPPPVDKPPGTLRLMTLGDSTIYGVLVGDGRVLSDVAANRLQQRLRKPVDVVNGGVPGYSSEQARRLYEHRLRAYSPDVVVIATMWSDAQLGPLPDAMQFPEHGAAVRRVLQNSALVRFLGGLLHGWVPGRDVAWELSAEPGVRRVPERAYRANLRRIAELVREDGAQPVFLQLPSDRDVRGEPVEPPRPAYRAVMAEVAREQGALWVDGVAPLLAARRGPPLMADDVHPTARGHELLGEALAQALAPTLQ